MRSILQTRALELAHETIRELEARSESYSPAEEYHPSNDQLRVFMSAR